jgi:hypothetical protein
MLADGHFHEWLHEPPQPSEVVNTDDPIHPMFLALVERRP